MKKLLFLAATACALCYVSCSSASSGSSASGAVESFYSAINAGDYEKAADCLYFEGKNIEADKKMMVEILSTYLGPELKKMGGVKIEILSEQIGGNGEATVEFNMTNGSGKTDKDKAICVKDASGAWKLRPAF